MVVRAIMYHQVQPFRDTCLGGPQGQQRRESVALPPANAGAKNADRGPMPTPSAPSSIMITSICDDPLFFLS